MRSVASWPDRPASRRRDRASCARRPATAGRPATRGPRHAAGDLHLSDGRRDRFECDGVDVWPQLVELSWRRHPFVADVAVAPRPDPELGAFGVAVTVPSDPEHPPSSPTSAVLRRAARGLAPSGPRSIAEHLPLTATGQVHRRMLAYDEAAR